MMFFTESFQKPSVKHWCSIGDEFI